MNISNVLVSCLLLEVRTESDLTRSLSNSGDVLRETENFPWDEFSELRGMEENIIKLPPVLSLMK